MHNHVHSHTDTNVFSTLHSCFRNHTLQIIHDHSFLWTHTPPLHSYMYTILHANPNSDHSTFFSTNTVILNTHTGICIHSHSTNLIWIHPTHIITCVFTSVQVVTCTAFLVTNMHFISVHHNGVNYFYCSN